MRRSCLQGMRAVVVLSLLVATRGPAVGASLVYIKDGNVWIASPDGATHRPVTSNGSVGAPYFSPSQADDGTIVAGRGSRIYRMNQSGTLLGPPIPTLVSERPPNVYAVGPFNPRVSPDGATVAYWIGIASGSYDPGCDCIVNSPVESTVYARTDGTGTIGFSRFWQTPSWITSTYVLLFAPGNRQTPQVGVGSLAALGSEQGWFNDDGAGFDGYWQNLDDGELDRSGTKLVLVRGVQAERLSFYAVTGFPERPVLVCEGSGPSGAFAGPAWSPDGLAVAWYENDGVWISPAPAHLTSQGACDELAPQLFAAGASEPRWGLADVAPEPATPRATASGTASPTRTSTAAPTLTPTPTHSPAAVHTETPPVEATTTSTRTATPQLPATQTPTETATASQTPTPTENSSASPTPAGTVPPGGCVGDCNVDGVVTVDELVRGVNVALGSQPPSACAAFDVSGNGVVTVDELVRGVNAALGGCLG